MAKEYKCDSETYAVASGEGRTKFDYLTTVILFKIVGRDHHLKDAFLNPQNFILFGVGSDMIERAEACADALKIGYLRGGDVKGKGIPLDVCNILRKYIVFDWKFPIKHSAVWTPPTPGSDEEEVVLVIEFDNNMKVKGLKEKKRNV